MQDVGLIGLGLLGSAMAKRMIAGGFPLRGYDSSSAARDNAAAMGVTIASSANDVFASCEVVLLSLPTTQVVDRVLADAAEALRPGHLIIDTTTGDPEQMAALGARLSARNIQYLDATIAASSAQVLVGDAVVMVGGAAEAFQACQKLFATFSRESVLVGGCGNGARMKLVVNLMLGLSRAALAETLTFAGKLGLDRRASLEILRSGNAYSRVMDTKGEKMLTGDFTLQARLSQHLKDVRLILEYGQKNAASLPLSEVHRDLLESCERAGLGDRDNSAVIKMYENPAPASPAFAHLTIATRDVQREATFFDKAMGWPRVNVPANAPEQLKVAWVQIAPRQQIHILYVENFEPSPFEAEFGRHTAVFHPTGDFPALKRRLVEHGATLVDPIRPTPFDRFFFRDPNGYMFEVIAREQYVQE